MKPLHKVKVVLVGNAGVGKTCLARKFTEGLFPPGQDATVGVDFLVKSVDLNGDFDVRFQILDISRQGRFRSLFPDYCHAVVLVYDVSSRPTFDCLPNWLQEINVDAEVLQVLVGNKTDREDREVPTSVGEEFATRNNMYFMETSAKEGDSGEKLFVEVARAVLEKRTRLQVATRDKEERCWKLKIIDAALTAVLFDHSLDSMLSEEALNKLRTVYHDEHARLDPKDEILVSNPELRTLIEASVTVQGKGILDKHVTASGELYRTSESPEEKNTLLQIIIAPNPIDEVLKLIEQRKEEESELDKQILEATSKRYSEIKKLEERIAKVKQTLETVIMNPPEVAQIPNALKEEVSQTKVQLVNEN